MDNIKQEDIEDICFNVSKNIILPKFKIANGISASKFPVVIIKSSLYFSNRSLSILGTPE